jgi:tetrahydromethanopterin S-methyltransferase subunit G
MPAWRDIVMALPMEVRMARLEGAYEQISDRLNGLDRRLDGLEQKVDLRFAQVDQRFVQMDQRFMWVIGLIVTSWVTTLSAVVFHR